jgi:hypothetical protein
LGLHRKLLRAPYSNKNYKYGDAGLPDWDSFHLQNVSAKTAFALALCGIPVRAGLQQKLREVKLDSQSKIAKNEKFYTKTKFNKQRNMLQKSSNLKSID